LCRTPNESPASARDTARRGTRRHRGHRIAAAARLPWAAIGFPRSSSGRVSGNRAGGRTSSPGDCGALNRDADRARNGPAAPPPFPGRRSGTCECLQHL